MSHVMPDSTPHSKKRKHEESLVICLDSVNLLIKQITRPNGMAEVSPI